MWFFIAEMNIGPKQLLMIVVLGRIRVLRMASSVSAEQSATYKCKEGPARHPRSGLQPAVFILSPAKTALIYFDNLSRAPQL